MSVLRPQTLGWLLVGACALCRCDEQRTPGDVLLERDGLDAVVRRDRGADLGGRDLGRVDGAPGSGSWVFLAGGRNGVAAGADVAVESTGHVLAAGGSSGEVPFGPVLHKQPGSLATRLSPNGKLDWVKAVHVPGAGHAGSIAIDATGRVLVAGASEGGETFGATTLTNRGNLDAYVAWLDATGKVASAVSYGGPEWDSVEAMTVDASGAIYLVGSFGGTADFGGTTLVSAGSTDIFVAKLDAQGKVQWAVRGGGVKGDMVAEAVAVDHAGNIYIAANFWSPATYGSISVEPKSVHDSVVLKLDPSGKFLWAAQASGNKLYFNGLALDSSGNPHVTGSFVDTAKIGNKSIDVTASSTLFDLLVAKVSASGTVEWAVAVSDAEGRAVAVDAAGNSYITGNYSHFASFGPFGLISAGWDDVFVAKLGPSRSWLGAISAGGKLSDVGMAISLDGARNVYVTGLVHFDSFNPSAVNQGTVTFGKQTLQLDGAKHLFVWKIAAGQL